MTSFSLMRWWAIARKESLHVLRDPWSLALGIFIPVIMLVLFGYALTLDVDRVPTVVWDQSNTRTSRDFLSLFGGSRYFSINGYVDRYDQIERAIDHGEALVALVIPRSFAADISTGNDVAIQFIVDGSDANTASIATNYATAIAQGFSLRVAIEQSQRRIGQAPRQPIDLRPRVWFNADMKSRDAIVPGLISLSMMIISALLTSLTVAREWEGGTMEQLISTPIRAPELVFGKLAPYFTIGMFDMLLVTLMGHFVFDVPLRGSVTLLLITSAIFLLGALGVGILISILTRTQLMSSQLSMIVTFLPGFLLSGFIYPIENMPRPLQIFTNIIPARHFIEMLRAIFLKGVGLEVLWRQFTILSIFAAIVLLLANLRFRKKLI